MSEMVERVARAMFETFMDWQFGQPLEWEGNPPPNAAELDREWRDREWVEQSEYHLRLARAAIEAMAVSPTDAMVKAGEDAYWRKQSDMLSPTPTEEPGCGPAGYCYRAMISAALKP